MCKANTATTITENETKIQQKNKRHDADDGKYENCENVKEKRK